MKSSRQQNIHSLWSWNRVLSELVAVCHRQRALEHWITTLLPISESRRDDFVWPKRPDAFWKQPVQPKAGVHIGAGIAVIMLASLVVQAQRIVRQAAPPSFGKKCESVA